MNVGIYSNRNYLERDNANILRIKERFLNAGYACKIVEKITDVDGLEVLFVLGGDGTILTVAAECARRKVKIIGINYGHIGFLTEFEADRIDEAVSLVIEGNFKLQKRNLLEISYGGDSFLALNEVVIQRNTGAANYSNIVNIHAEIDGTTVDNFSSDGLIVSTPTGSTAYSLSAGGSVLSPDLHAFGLTPICAHSLHSRPVVFSDESTVTISPVSCRDPLVMTVDGKVVGYLPAGEKVIIKKSGYFAEFITRGEEDFFKKLLIKLSIWSK